MNKLTRNDLEGSIRHWSRMARGKRNFYEGHLSDSCALCRRFLEQDCVGCPIFKDTGARNCENKYWSACNSAWRNNNRDYDSPAFKDAAKEFLVYLKSLRPKI